MGGTNSSWDNLSTDPKKICITFSMQQRENLGQLWIRNPFTLGYYVSSKTDKNLLHYSMHTSGFRKSFLC